MSFLIAKAHKEMLENLTSHASNKLNAFPRGPSGLASDEVRRSPEYRLAKAEYQAAVDALRNFNKVYVKQFKKELAAERKAKYATAIQSTEVKPT